MGHDQTPRAKGSPIYLLPSMFTLTAIFCGFYAIVQSINGNFINAGIAILFSMVFDSLDGRVARLTRTSSPFGAQLDSLADMVSFGVAPALIMFSWQANTLGKFGWVASFVYCACAAIRLARFNVMIDVVDKRYFQGLPSPTAAILIVGYIYICQEYALSSPLFILLGAIITLASGLSMVSNIKFYSFKEFHFHQKAPFRSLVIFIFILAAIAYCPELTIYGFFIGYFFFGFATSLTSYFKDKKNKQITSSDIVE